ncbi:hypothetical protein AAFC00_000643 [Neodothiora populina]|uniref:Uncharacterized protein n=1 Tax=Neodothiora populina TaxID=2781224 RepID=A0ABR3PE41_9PEZI
MIQTRGRLLEALSKALRSEDQRAFASIFQTILDLDSACNENGSLDIPSRFGYDRDIDNDAGFFHGLSRGARDASLHFLRRTASDPRFLFHLLSCLSTKGFDAFLGCHIPGEPSLLGGHEDTKSGQSRRASTAGLKDLVLDLGRHDPLALLLHIAGPESADSICADSADYWAIVCSALLSDRVPGAEKFVVAVLNAWPTSPTFPGMHPLETWLLEVLKDGSFILKRPDKRSFGTRFQTKQGQDVDDAESCDAFFNQCIISLLELLRNTADTDLIPGTTLKLGQAIVSRLRDFPDRCQAAPTFLATRWLFSSYLTNLIRNPESFGLLLSSHVSTAARRRILDELALRLQGLAYDVAYPWHNHTSVEDSMARQMQDIISMFRPLDSADAAFTDELSLHTPTKLVTLCPSDLLTLSSALFPLDESKIRMPITIEQRSTSLFSDSSISGSSQSNISALNCKADPKAEYIRAPGSICDPLSQSVVNTQQFDNQEASDHCMGGPSIITDMRYVCSEIIEVYHPAATMAYEDPFSEIWCSMLLKVRSSSSDEDTISHLSRQAATINLSTNDAIPDYVKDAVESILETHVRTPQSGYVSGDLRRFNDESIYDDYQNVTITLSNAIAASASGLERKCLYSKAYLFRRAYRWIQAGLGANTHGKELSSYMIRLAQSARRFIDLDCARTKSLDEQADNFRVDEDQQASNVSILHETMMRLREKMWYISSVRFAGQYETLLGVSSALRTMGLPVKSANPSMQPHLRHRATRLQPGAGLAPKSESAILELLAAPPAHGGPNKLSDKQVILTSTWLQEHGIENICKGEERLHRFCREVKKCVKSIIGDSVMEHPLLWSSDLFMDCQPAARSSRDLPRHPLSPSSARERLRGAYGSLEHHLPSLRVPSSHSGSGNIASSNCPDWLGIETGFSMLSQKRSNCSGSCSPTFSNSTSDTIYSSFSSFDQASSSVTSLPSHIDTRTLSDRSSTTSLKGRQHQRDFLDELRCNISGLILSEMGHLFHAGSETDIAMWELFDGRFAKTLSSLPFEDETHIATEPPAEPNTETPSVANQTNVNWSPRKTFQHLLKTMSVSPNPRDKLRALYQVQEVSRIVVESDNTQAGWSHSEEHKRDGTSTRRRSSSVLSDQHDASSTPSNNDVVNFRRIFLDGSIRPKTLFRDLQYIAVLVSSTVTDETEEGQAFWNATIAAMSIKQDILRSMIETADAVVAHHTLTRGHSSVASAAQAERDSATFTMSRPGSAAAAEGIIQYDMSDAAQMYMIAANEGDPVAQRELATLYLTHPETTKRAVAPLTKAGDVFESAAASYSIKGGRRGSVYGGGGGDGQQRQDDHDKYDPVAMAIARHWMELAAAGGDDLARNTLKATDEIERIP